MSKDSGESGSSDHPGIPAANSTPDAKRPDTEIIPAQLDSVLRASGVNPEDPKVRTAVEISLMAFRGTMPLPPPTLLAQFEEVRPGIVEKIIGWTEEQRAHRQGLERKRTEGDETRKYRAQFIGAGVAGLGLILAAAVGIWGSAWAAAVIAIVAVGGPVAAVALALGFFDPHDEPPTSPPKA